MMKVKISSNENGFSLVEVLIGIGIVGILLMAGMNFFSSSEKNLKKIQNKMETMAENVITEREILRDIWRAKPSYNVSCQKDDNGKLFFYFRPSCSSDCSREISLDSPTKSFTLIVTNIKASEAGISVPYLAQDAFKVNSSSASFISLNNGNILESSPNSLWKKDNLLLIYADRYQEEDGPCGNHPYQENYVGFVTGSGNTKLEKLVQDDVIISKFESEQDFLENHDQVLGLSNNIFIMPINVVRYTLGSSPNKPGYYDLYRSEYKKISDVAQFSPPKRVALGIKKVIFLRHDVTIPSISVLLKNK